MELICKNVENEKELTEVLRLFYPTFEEEQEGKIFFEKTEDEYVIDVLGKIFRIKKYLKKEKSDEKRALYLALSSALGKTFEWGSLTGVRPTKLAYDLLSTGTEKHLLKETLIRDYNLSENKAKLVRDVISNQNCIIKNDNLVDFFVNIPICPSRCKYCSFISSEFGQVKDMVENYVEALICEIKAAKEIIAKKNLIVRSVYVGGGTPTVLSAQDLKRILSEINFRATELTVEAGRPDTITREKLSVLKEMGVTRICVNPQTFCERTLKAIGRNHGVKEILSAYKLAVEFGFDVNLDLIAGLPGETFQTFKKSLQAAIEMAPANITVHALALKRGSMLTIQKQKNKSISLEVPPPKEVEKMISFANAELLKEGFVPYYLYRQKNTPLGLENVGYAQKGKICLFNVDSMEETTSVIACGANAISKRVFSVENRIERSPNVKFIDEYISRLDEMIERKKQLFI